MKRILIICTAVMLLAMNAWADTIIFKSGKKVEGNIKAITNDSVTVDLYGVTEMTYDLADIQEINGQVVEIKKPAAAAEAPASETAASPAQTSPPAENIAPAPASQVPSETAEVTMPSAAQQEKISGLSAGETRKIQLSNKGTKAMLAVLGAVFVILIVVGIILYIYAAICLQTIAKKTGAENGWMAWIPIANIFLSCNIGNVRYIWLLLLLVGFVPLVGTFLAPICDLFLFGFIWYRIALARGKEGWIGAITVIPVVGLFTMGYLAFSKEEGAAPAPNIGGGQPANPLGTTPPNYKPPLE